MSLATLDMAEAITTTTTVNTIPCPITKLPPELRKLIYQHYYESMEGINSKPYTAYGARHIYTFRRLKHYFGLLHLSSGVRPDTVSEIYKAAFSEWWFAFTLDKEDDETDRMKDMLTCVRNANKNVDLGLRFFVADHSLPVFLRFVDCFFDLSVKGDTIRPTFVHSSHFEKPRRLTESEISDGKLYYTYKSLDQANHLFWMYGTLARLDWSKFEFKVPTLEETRAIEKSFYEDESSEPDDEHDDDGNEKEEEEEEEEEEAEEEDNTGLLGAGDEVELNSDDYDDDNNNDAAAEAVLESEDGSYPFGGEE